MSHTAMTVKCSDIGDDQDMLVAVTLDIILDSPELTEFEMIEEEPPPSSVCLHMSVILVRGFTFHMRQQTSVG
jgi:hypothetical protein